MNRADPLGRTAAGQGATPTDTRQVVPLEIGGGIYNGFD